ncbi:hypothetical protein ACOMHN_042248 [Nucella lapillus]
MRFFVLSLFIATVFLSFTAEGGPVDIPPPPPGVTCADAQPDCYKFGPYMCEYDMNWMKQHCTKYCNMCQK